MKLLVVDDETAVLSALHRELRQLFGHRLEVETCNDPTQALSLVRAHHFDIVMSDLRMPELDGVSFLNLVSAVSPDSVRMILTGSADFETAQRAINDAGVFRYLTKPWSRSELRNHVEAALAVRRNGAPLPEPDAQEQERQRLEALDPGITSVKWGPAGEVLMPPLGDD
jgi:two-component system, probable response regulator PhcQ